ncbi:MAG: ABC transporter substrate-binding protein [Firmicutes bacterium ZCTH02-B6]|nr:MAG: ABC transporter substrate-binding protein [Firmicutes bacterium ZCTH02-B6]
MLKRAYLLLLAAAMVFPVGLAGVAQPVLAQVGTVKFMHLWPSGEARQHNIIVNEIIADFMSEHPDAFVEVEALPNEQYKDKITVLAASNQLPDVGFTWAAGYMTPFVQAGQFAPLDELLDQDGLREQFVSGTLQAFAIDGVTYGLPLELNVAPIFYNKRIFARYGLDVPRTWDEFLHVVEVLRDNGVTPIALGNGERWTGSLWYMYLADRIAGPDVVNDAINGRIPFTHPGLIRAAEEVQRLVRMDAFSLGYNALSNAEAKAEFLTEQAAMWLIGSWELPQFTTDETVSKEFRDSIGFFRFPVVAGGAGPDTGWVGGPGVALFINANSTVKDKAEAFAKYFVQQWGQRAVAEAGVIPGTIVDTSKVQLPQMYLDVLDELAAATSITLYADVQLTPAAAQVHLNQIQALFGLQVTPEQFAQAHDEAIRGGR